MSPTLLPLLLSLALAGDRPLLDALRDPAAAPAACQRALALPERPGDCRVQLQAGGALVTATTGCGGDTCGVVAAVVRPDGVHPLPETLDGASLLGGTTVLLPGAGRVLTDRLRPGEAAGSWRVDTAVIDVDTASVQGSLGCFSVALGPDGRGLTCRDRAGALLHSATWNARPQVLAAGPGPAAVDWAPYKWIMPEPAIGQDGQTVRYTLVGPGGGPVETRSATLPALPRPEGLDGWVEVPPPSGALPWPDGAPAHLQTRQGCLPARLTADTIEVELCRTATATCTWSHGATGPWTPGAFVSCERPDGSGWGSGSGGGHHDLPEIVRADREAIEWASAPELEARAETERLDERPCTAESATAGTDHGRGPARRCHHHTGHQIAPRPRGHGGALGMGVGWSPTPVDCREPCPPDPDGDRIARTAAWLSGRRFVAEDAPRIGLYATEQACRDAQHEPALSVDLEACAGGD